MPMKVEAAIVTQKRPEAAYNTDSVNVNGKVMPREVIKNGYKGSGVLGGSVYFALTSSEVEGFADATVTAFNQRAELFAHSRNPVSVFSGFFEDCRGALLNMDRAPEELVSAGFYATGRSAVLAYNGNAGLYLQRLGVLTPVSGEKVTDTIADFSSASFNDVCVGDIFILLSPGAAQALTDKDIEDILKISDGSVKKIVNYILKVALSKSSDKAVSAIVVKVLDVATEEEIIPAFIPDFSQEETAEEAPAEEVAKDSSAEEAPAEEETAAQSDDIAAIFSKNALEMFEEGDGAPEESSDDTVTDEAAELLYTEAISDEADELPEEVVAETKEAADAEDDASEEDVEEGVEAEEKPATDKKKTILLFAAGVLIPVVIAVLIFFVIVPSFSGEEETTAEETTVEETTEEETTAEETTAEETTEEETTEEETTEERTTRRREESTTRRPAETTTARPVVAPVETTAEETTTEEATTQEETTAAEETTEEEGTTAAAEEETTAAEQEEATEATTEAEAEPSTEEQTDSSEENTDEQ